MDWLVLWCRWCLRCRAWHCDRGRTAGRHGSCGCRRHSQGKGTAHPQQAGRAGGACGTHRFCEQGLIAGCQQHLPRRGAGRLEARTGWALVLMVAEVLPAGHAHRVNIKSEPPRRSMWAWFLRIGHERGHVCVCVLGGTAAQRARLKMCCLYCNDVNHSWY